MLPRSKGRTLYEILLVLTRSGYLDFFKHNVIRQFRKSQDERIALRVQRARFVPSLTPHALISCLALLLTFN